MIATAHISSNNLEEISFNTEGQKEKSLFSCIFHNIKGFIIAILPKFTPLVEKDDEIVNPDQVVLVFEEAEETVPAPQALVPAVLPRGASLMISLRSKRRRGSILPKTT